ncbi:MAG: hypothetical protein WKG01_04960 [Kofleriaceae bacterium]
MIAWRLDARALSGLLAVVVVWAAALLIHQHASAQPVIAIAAAFDVTVTASVALYLIAVRGGHLPRWTLGPTLGLGLVLARFVVADPRIGDAAIAAGIVLELAVLALLVVRGRRAVRAWRLARVNGATRVDAIVDAFTSIGMPRKVASIAATEATLIASVVTGWRRPVSRADRFTVHRLNGWPLYAGVLIVLSAVELVAVHIVLVLYATPVAAWIVSGLTAYSILWILGDALALRHGGITVGKDALAVDIGVRWRGSIPRDLIVEAARGTAPEGALRVAVLEANVVLRLREPVTMQAILGIRRTNTVIALSIDDPDAFLAALAQR